MRRSLLLTAGVAVLALVASGCGDDDEPTVAQSDTTTAPAPDGGDEQDEGDEQATTTVALAETDEGSVLVDGEGRTLYLFTRDSADSSACTDGCLESWPPLVAEGEVVAGDGVDASKLGSFTRVDGAEQVTYASKPLYYFAADSGPGDTNGQGVNEVWWMVGVDGEPVMAAAAPSGGGY